MSSVAQLSAFILAWYEHVMHCMTFKWKCWGENTEEEVQRHDLVARHTAAHLCCPIRAKAFLAALALASAEVSKFFPRNSAILTLEVCKESIRGRYIRLSQCGVQSNPATKAYGNATHAVSFLVAHDVNV